MVTGYTTTLRGVCTDPAAATYVWKNSAGTVVDSGTVADPYSIESAPITITASGTYTLTVFDGADASLGSDTYTVSAVTNTTTNLKDIAIDDGLWFMHKSLVRYAIDPANGGGTAAYEQSWEPARSRSARVSSTPAT